MMKRMAALAALLVLSGCIGAGAGDSPVKGKPIDPQAQAQANFMAEMDGLKSQVKRLTAEVEDLGLQVRAFTEGDGSGGGGNTLPELSKRIQKLEGNIKQMSSQLGVEVDGQQPAAGQQPMAGQQPAQPGGPNPFVSPGQPQVQPQTPAQAPASSAGAGLPPGADPAEAIYSKGMQAFQAKEYDKAAAMWRDVAKNYPKHNLASNAYFWMGEAYFQKGDMAQAALNYNEVVEKFPKSTKAPSAMLKMGMAFQKLNKKDAARLMFQDLIKKFPDSAEARRAKTLL